MDFARTKLTQRTRSCYDRLYKEFNEKKSTGRRRNPQGGGSISESGEDWVDRVGESSGKSSDVVKGSGGKIEVRSRKIKKGREVREKLGGVSERGKNAKPAFVIEDSDDGDGDDDDDDHVVLNQPLPENHSEFGSEENLGENLDNKSARTNDSQNNSDDEDALPVLDDNDVEKKSEKGFLCDSSDSSDDCLKGERILEDKFGTLPGHLIDESDDHESDDIPCLDDCDPSHGSRVGSNDVRLSPVELDSIQADDDEGDESQELKSPEEDDTDRRGSDPPENAGVGGKDGEVISLSSSSDDEEEEDDDESSVLEPDKIGDTGDGFWTEVFKKGPLYESVPKKRRADADTSLGCGRKAKLKKEQSVHEANEQPFWVADYSKQHFSSKDDNTQKAVNITGKKQLGNVNDVIKILTETIKEGEDGDELLKQYVTPKEEDSPLIDSSLEETSVEQVLSYKFRFEDEESMKQDESETEMELDGLFDEMNVCFQLSEIGSSGASVVNHGAADLLMENIDQATLCRLGKHQLIINDQFGIICRYCQYVEIEVRDILPPLGKNGRGGHARGIDTDKTDNLNFSDLPFADGNQECSHDSKGSEYEKGTVWDLVPGVKETMYPHQRDGFEFIWKKIAGGTYIEKLEKRLSHGGSGCIISHAPGTGKSRLTIVFLQAFMRMYPDSRPIIIAPRCMLLTWEEEFKKWEADVPFHNLNNKEYSGQEDGRASTLLKQNGNGKSLRCLRLVKLYSWKRKSSVLGITYRLFESLAGEEGKKKKNSSTINNFEDEEIKKMLLQIPTLLVLDEGHTPRNEESLVWKALRNVKTKRSIILSGTPFQNNFDELYNTFCLVNPLLPFDIVRNGGFTIKHGRKNNVVKGKWDSITSEVLKSRNRLNELKAMIDPFVHVHKGTILQEKLPGLKDALVVLKPTKTQKTLLGMMSGKSQVENDHVMSSVAIHPSLVQEYFIDNEGYHRLLKMYENDPRAGVKTNFLMELVKLSCALKERVLVFSQYTKPLKFIMELLGNKFNWVRDREILYMDGQQEEKNRQASINTLNDPKSEVKILFASIRACSEGINLVGASRVVLLDVQWNPSVERQAISRAYRLGQKKLVYVYHLVTGTMEGEKYIRQVEKSHLSELVFSLKNGAGSKSKISSVMSGDKILEEMVQHDKLQHMFEKVIYQPKEADLVNTFV